MITEYLLETVLYLPNQILDKIEPVSIETETLSTLTNASDVVTSIFNVLSYVVPVPTVLFVLGSMIALKTARIAIALMRRVKSFVPTMGE